MDDGGRRTDGGSTALAGRPRSSRRTPRTPDELLADAWAIRRLLDDLGDEEHRTRTKLLVARDELRLEAARQWRRHGWRPITDEF